jgi:hypothetical protein
MSLLPNFPSSPTNGQVATVGDYSYTYNSTTDSWEGVLGGSSGSGTFAQVFTTSGTFTVPTGVTAVKVTVIGGGGGGSGSGTGDRGMGGGGGGVSIKYITGLTPGGSVSVTVGSGGTAGSTSSPGAGSSGGTSSFGGYCTATGGAGGGAYTELGASGGVGSGGDINITGGNGGVGSSQSGSGVAVIGGAGGGSSGTNGGSGDFGVSPNNPIFVPGGTGFLGGSGGTGRGSGDFTPQYNGNPGTGFGNGGAGGTNSPASGGAGSAGVVLVEWSASVLVVSTTTGGGIGYDQSWTDVSGSRTFGVSYTNSTAKPIQILVGASTTGAGGGVALTINGVVLPGSFAYSPAVTVFSATAIVPVGATYAASAYGGASYASWHELR